MRRALLVGINDYDRAPLHGCVRDAKTLGNILEKNEDGSPNFSTKIITSDNQTINQSTLIAAVDDLLSSEADVALLYFSGHGHLTQTGGMLVTQESGTISGMPMHELLTRTSNAHKRVKSTIVILDCCHSGAAGEHDGLLAEGVSGLGKGVILLCASHRNGYAIETDGKGIFTDLLIEGLRGASSDIRGNITPAALYSLVDQTLGPWDQRPVFKANVHAFVSLRNVHPKIPLTTLRNLPQWFPTENHIFQLDPQFEPNRENTPYPIAILPRDKEKEEIFASLQTCNRFGLVVPHDEDHMYYAAINSTGCRLTPLGIQYRKLANLGRI